MPMTDWPVAATLNCRTQWSKRQRESMAAIYGLDELQAMWSSACDGWKRLYEEAEGNVCVAEAHRVTCETLIVHGRKDPIILPEHPVELQAAIGMTFLSLASSLLVGL